MRTLKILMVVAGTMLMSLGIPAHVIAAPRPQPLDARSEIAGLIQPGQTIRRALVLPWHANMVDVSFLGPDLEATGVRITLGANDRGRPTWYDLRVEPDESGDAWEFRRQTARIVTLPQWVGRARRVEVEITLARDAQAIRDVRLEAQNTVGNAFDVPTPIAFVRAIGRFLTATRIVGGTPAEAMTSQPTIIPRSDWNRGRCERSSGPGDADELHAAIVHHTVNSNSYSKSEAASLVLGVCRYHTQNLDYSDIAYNFLIDRYGQIFEGRAGGIDQAVIGAHAGGFNRGTTGIALIGTFTSSSPPSAMLTSLRRLLAWKLDVHHVPPTGTVRMVSGGGSRYDEGQVVWLNRISGHRDASQTSCPGSRTYDLLPGIRTSVNGMGHPKIYLPSPSHTALDLTGIDADGPFRVAPRFSRSVAWRFRIRTSTDAIVFSRSGSGTSMARTWDGRGTDGLLVPSGSYRWEVTATDGQGRAARPATGWLAVEADWSPPFFDDEGYPQEPSIDAIAAEGITSGCAPQRFCPSAPVTRGQMAVFLTRALGLHAASNQDYFSDDEGHFAEASINTLAAAGIVAGCGADSYCPNRAVTRAQMAVLLVRGFEYPPTDTDFFSDDTGSFAEAQINALAAAGITSGCGAGLYCPARDVRRAHMAVFLARALANPPAEGP